MTSCEFCRTARRGKRFIVFDGRELHARRDDPDASANTWQQPSFAFGWCLIQTTPPDLRLRRADTRRAYSLKMAASLACARALKTSPPAKFSMHENKLFVFQLGAEFAAKMDGRCVICRVFNRLWLHPMDFRLPRWRCLSHRSKWRYRKEE
jgi:hypothetical protein